MISSITKYYPHKEFLKSISPGLDDYEKPIIEKMIKFYQEDVKGFKDFGYRYPTNGSSEGIYHLLSKIKTEEPDVPIYSLEGEYEGYRECAAGMGMKVQEVPEDMEIINNLPVGYWFISNPSARNGNIVENNLIKQIADLGNKVILDLAYLGSTKRHMFELTHPNIMAVLTSMSKPFGLFYYRLGFTFSREPVKTLYGTKWFKNILSLIIADKVFGTFTSDYFYKKYSQIQKEILKQINNEIGIGIRLSDVFLLGYLTAGDFEKLSNEQKEMVAPFKRGEYYRFCLTQYFLEREK